MAPNRQRKRRNYRRPTLEERPYSLEDFCRRRDAFRKFVSVEELRGRGVDPSDRGTILSAMLQPLERLPLYLRRNPHGRGYIF